MNRAQLNLTVVPTVLVAVLAAPFVLYWSELPDPMAIHWGPGGGPDGSAPPIVLAVGLIIAAVAIVLAVRRVVAMAPVETSSFVAGMYAILVLLAVVAWLSVGANRNAVDWESADSITLIAILGAFAAGLVAGVVGWFLSGGNDKTTESSRGETPMAEIADPGRAVWSGRGYGKVTTALGVGVIVVGLAVWHLTGWVLILVGIVGLIFAVVRVTISGGGVVVSLGWWGYPMWKVPIESVERAELETVVPMAYGGWGYRARPGVRAVVTRGGEAIRLVRANGPDLVYTVDDAEAGAGLVNAIVATRRR